MILISIRPVNLARKLGSGTIRHNRNCCRRGSGAIVLSTRGESRTLLFMILSNNSSQDKMMRNSTKLYKLVTFFAMLCAMVGCSALQQKVEMDASTAAQIAVNAGDTAGAACFNALEPVVGTAPAGLLSTFEAVRAGRIAVEEGPARRSPPNCCCTCLTKCRGCPEGRRARFSPVKTGEGAARAPHPNPHPASGEREGPAKREGEGQ